MDNREFDQVLMNIKNASGTIIGASLFSARISFMLLTYILRLAKKGLVAAGFADNFKAFTKNTEGKFTVYNIPLSAEKAHKVSELNSLELRLQNTKKVQEKVKLRNELKKLKKEFPELEQLKKLGISHCMLPKLNGSKQTIQVAVANRNEQQFKNWFLNHLTTELSGGEKGMEDLQVFTEGNVSIFNLPLEGEELTAALADFQTLGMNYSVLPDLKVGDGNSQIAIPNSDRSKLEMWFKIWKDKQLKAGKEVGELYSIDQESYVDTGRMEAAEYVEESEPIYKEVNAEFEEQAREVPWSAGLQKENSEEYVRYLQDKNYERITINKETLINKMSVSTKAAEMQKNGYFISRVPGTFGASQQTLILPKEQVFMTDAGKTYVAFLPKNRTTMVASSEGNITEQNFKEIYAPYDKVNRNLKKIEALKKGAAVTKSVNIPKAPLPQTPKL